MELNDKLFELIKTNSSNKDYRIGDALLELFPIDYIKKNSSQNDAISICCEKNQQNEVAIINAIQYTIELISENAIILKSSSNVEQIGSMPMPGLGYNKSIEFTEYVQTNYNIWDIISGHFSVPE
jgi:hypothetical protein